MDSCRSIALGVLIAVLVSVAYPQKLPLPPPTPKSSKKWDERDIFTAAIARYSRRANLLPLGSTKNRGRKEIRIWAGFGALAPRCLIYRERGSKTSVTALKFEPGDGVDTRSISVSRDVARDFRDFVESNTPQNADVSVADPDQEGIAIEIRIGKQYQLYFFPKSSTADQDLKLLDYLRSSALAIKSKLL